MGGAVNQTGDGDHGCGCAWPTRDGNGGTLEYPQGHLVELHLAECDVVGQVVKAQLVQGIVLLVSPTAHRCLQEAGARDA